MKFNKSVVKVAALSGALVLATGSLALAHGGFSGHRGHHMQLGLLARAAGVSRSDIGSAFHGNQTLESDFAAVKSAHTALINCLVSPMVQSSGGCGGDISALANAQAKLSTDRLTAWEGLFAKAPNLSNANTVLGELNNLKTQEQALHQQKHQILSSVFGNKGAGSDTP